jgi:uncharacterized protein (TIGR03435 family)
MQRRLLVFLLAAVSTYAQQTPRPFAYDVATIKPVQPDAPKTFSGVMDTPDGIDAEFVTVPMLMKIAYGGMTFISDKQIIGAPAWASSQTYNIRAKITEADLAALQKLTPEERKQSNQQMLQTLLAERFNLKVHRETRQLPVYELVLAKGGSKLKPIGDDDPGVIKGTDGQLIKGSMARFERSGKIIVQQYSMPELAILLTQLAQELDRPVLDKTGLTGKYNFTLNWSPTIHSISSHTDADDAVSIFTALQEDLGLRLQPSTGPVEVLVIDHVDKPSDN